MFNPIIFQVLHGEGSEDWTLQIKFVQKRDNGTYECQRYLKNTALIGVALSAHLANRYIVKLRDVILGIKIFMIRWKIIPHA
ncbi:unnamed protein product [Euphydryas editha]|uniref:Immunoglobulin V-set domain-containing protein n=1 Tax=Euphydryas editha TaxID=104508 RepID=A0AAU9TVF5_EUPED|nr:unnamed protein product [Euphydryas editha]